MSGCLFKITAEINTFAREFTACVYTVKIKNVKKERCNTSTLINYLVQNFSELFSSFCLVVSS